MADWLDEPPPEKTWASMAMGNDKSGQVVLGPMVWGRTEKEVKKDAFKACSKKYTRCSSDPGTAIRTKYPKIIMLCCSNSCRTGLVHMDDINIWAARNLLVEFFKNDGTSTDNCELRSVHDTSTGKRVEQ
jgi:hypothetical protein